MIYIVTLNGIIQFSFVPIADIAERDMLKLLKEEVLKVEKRNTVEE